jgi:hypothetical protein
VITPIDGDDDNVNDDNDDDNDDKTMLVTCTFDSLSPHDTARAIAQRVAQRVVDDGFSPSMQDSCCVC